MTESSRAAADATRSHYSYTHYADRGVAERFDALRFGGPIGRYLLDSQQAILEEALAPLAGRHVLDVGTGTGRAAIGLAGRGARVSGLDYSGEMLRVADARVRDLHLDVHFAMADAHRLPVADGAVDAAVCLRLLMHAIEWRACVSELCRVSRWRVVIDFPALASLAAVESVVRRTRRALGSRTEAYRVIAERDVTEAFKAGGFRVVMVRRQFVLPVAVHKAINRLPFTTASERALAAVGLLRAFGSPVTVVAER